MADDAKSLFQKGIEAIRDQQDAAAGRKLLLQSLQLDPKNDGAWVWLSYTVSDPQKKLECLKRALQMNPANPQALKLKQKLESVRPVVGGTQTGAPSPAAADGAELGNLLDSTRTNPWLLAVKITGVVICSVIAIAMVAALLIVNHYFPEGTGGLPLNEIFAALLVIALIGLGFFLLSFINPSKVLIEIYEKGIQRTQRGGTVSWRWEELSAVRIAEKIETYTFACIPVFRDHSYVCRVLIDNKVVLKIDKDFQKYKEAGTLIAQQTAPILFERDLKRYDSGETLRYGTIELNHDGIRDVWKFWKTALWRDIEHYDVDGPWLRIERFESPSVNFYLVDLPNLVSFLKMVDKLTA